MRVTTIVGMVLGLAMLVLAVSLTAHAPTMFLNGPGAIIVVGGTLAATLMSYSVSEIGRAFKAFAVTLRTEERYKRHDLNEALQIARIWYHGDIHAAERAIKRAKSPFLRTGLQMAIDGAPANQIMDVLDYRIDRLKTREHAEADVFQVMGSYAPAFGMVGTLLGLVNMLNDLGTMAMNQIAVNLAVALVTTFYGVVLANAVFKPMAVKLRRRTQDRVELLNLIKETVVLVSHEKNPVKLKYTLESFLDSQPDELDAPAPEARSAQGGHAG